MLLNKTHFVVCVSLFKTSCTMSGGKTSFEFQTPCSILIAGPSGSGKMEFTTKLLLQNLDLFSEKPKIIHYCYGSWQEGFKRLKDRGIKFSEGVPTEEDLDKWFPKGKGGILVMDDLMSEGGNEKTVVDIFTKHSHHRNITVLYLCQDLFPPGKFAKPSIGTYITSSCLKTPTIRRV